MISSGTMNCEGTKVAMNQETEDCGETTSGLHG